MTDRWMTRLYLSDHLRANARFSHPAAPTNAVGISGLGMAGHCIAGHVMAMYGEARIGDAWHGKAWQATSSVLAGVAGIQGLAW